MNISIVKEQDVIVSKWAGGESRQYFIFPPNSSYGARDFLFRVSKATSNFEEESKYSNLANFTRHLIMLDGVAHVFHKGYYDIVMNPYEEIDVFDGGWGSSATGKVTDFNLMTSKECKGSMSVINKECEIKTEDSKNLCQKWLMFFCGCGCATLDFSSGEKVDISADELVVIENLSSQFKINIQTENTKLVKMIVNCE